MTEIPMPASDPYQPAPKRSSSSDCCKWGAIICVLLIIGMLVIAMIFMGGILNLFGGIGNGSYDTRSIATYNNIDPPLFGEYYRGEFDVYSYETLTSTEPDISFDISVDDTGADEVSVTIHFAVYEIDQATFDSITTWAGVDPYLVEEGDYIDWTTDFFNLYSYSSTYVWVVWFEASSKTDVWTVDIDLTLRYNWGL